MERQIDMGDHGWKIGPNTEIIYGDEWHARKAAMIHGANPDKIVEVGTRPEICHVAEQLNDEIGHVWDDGGIQLFPTNPFDREAKWPEGRIKVFVVTGGSEGLYLHVEVVEKEDRAHMTRLILIAKTLKCSTDKWYECWMSAARIARVLGA